jgi:hypothetical protein
MHPELAGMQPLDRGRVLHAIAEGVVTIAHSIIDRDGAAP